MNDISDNDLANMDDDEMAQYVEDVSSGYMFDPDNKILGCLSGLKQKLTLLM